MPCGNFFLLETIYSMSDIKNYGRFKAHIWQGTTKVLFLKPCDAKLDSLNPKTKQKLGDMMKHGRVWWGIDGNGT